MLETTHRRKYKKRTNNLMLILGIVAVISIVVGLSVYIFSDDRYLTYLNINNNGKYSIKKFTTKLSELENELNIQEVDYKWTKELNIDNKPNKIIVHHAAGSNFTAEQINKMHVDKGYDGIGYHFYIRKDGTIYRGRPEEAEGAHTIGENKQSLGICLEGNMDKDELNDNQKESLEKLSEYLVIKYNLEKIDGHSDYYNTRCPGKNISIEGLNESVKNKLIELVNK